MQNNLQKAAIQVGPLVCQGIKPMKMLEHELKELLKESIMGIEDKSKFPQYEISWKCEIFNDEIITGCEFLQNRHVNHLIGATSKTVKGWVFDMTHGQFLG